MLNILNKMWDRFLGFLESKKIYKEHHGALISGVCKGLSEKTSIRVDLIRVIWLISAVISFGSSIIVYIICSIVMPEKPKKQNYQKMSYVDGYAQEKK